MSSNFNKLQSGIAATPATGDIFGVGVPRPGTSVAPARRMPFRGPGLSYVEWNNGPSGSSTMPNTGFGPDGLPRGQTTVREFMSNTAVQQQFFTNKWKNESELAMIEGQFVFMHRSVPQKIRIPASKLSPSIMGRKGERFGKIDLRSYVIINLPHFNGMLHRSWIALNSAADSYASRGRNPKRVIQAHRLRELMYLFSEDEIANYFHYQNDPEFASQFAWADDKNEVIAPKEMEELYQLAMSGNFKYAVFPQLILSEFNFLGSILALSRGTSMEGINNPNKRDDVLIVNTVMAKRAEVHNVFQPHTEVDSGSKLFFIYRRKRLADNRAGSFVIEPIACKHNERPTIAHRYYRDLSGCLCLGFIRYIGYVQLPGGRYPNPVRQQVASGVRPPTNFEQPKRATAIVPKIQIQIDMHC